MKTDDLLDSTNDELNKSENVENENVENDSINSTSDSEKEETQEKEESAADIILKKIKDNKSKSEKNDLEKETTSENLDEVVEEKEEESTPENVIEPEKVEAEQAETSKSEEITEKEEEENETVTEPEEVKVEKEFLIEDLDYTTLSQEELVNQLKILLEKGDIRKTKERIENIKVCFYKRHHAEIDEKKKAFLEAGGYEEDFSPASNPVEEQFKSYYTVFREKRSEYNVNLEQEKQENLALKYQIIDKIEDLITNKESLNKTFHDFKDLQKQWQEIGLVPQSEVKKLWDSYNYQIEKFYDYVKINKDLRDLDLKKNMELKIELCERAEELLLEPKIVSAFRDLQKLHAQWREIGPVPVEKKEELWERFKQATSKINKKHQEYFENLKNEQLNNLKAKTLLCEKVEELIGTEHSGTKEWEESSNEVIELQRMWKLIGFAPKKENNKIYARFRKACDSFFDAKREFYSKHKEEEENNLQLKTELCLQAESMQDSTDWRKTTDLYIEIQKKWKTIGPTPRKSKDEIWHRFRKACNTFFDRKAEHFSSKDDEQDNNLELKKALIEKVRNFEFSDDNHANFKALNQLQKEWTEIGHVPIKNKDEINTEYRTLLNEIFEKLDLSEGEKNKLQFRNKVETLKNSPKSYTRLKNEREKIISKMDKLKSNIVLWENNIGFFAKSKNADSMIKDFQNKIKKAKEFVQSLEEQLYMIDDLL
ncbi:MAG: DUF349 domain-containing protein [Bacteroidales bacterium]|nr:DUF349 domain-containing protein [Bacteroidales bacterium]